MQGGISVSQVYKFKINKNLCTGCNVCVNSCPINFDQLRAKGFLTEKNAVIMVKNGTAIAVYVEGRDVNCDGCGICIKNCPQDAIKIEILSV